MTKETVVNDIAAQLAAEIVKESAEEFDKEFITGVESMLRGNGWKPNVEWLEEMKGEEYCKWANLPEEAACVIIARDYHIDGYEICKSIYEELVQQEVAEYAAAHTTQTSYLTGEAKFDAGFVYVPYIPLYIPGDPNSTT